MARPSGCWNYRADATGCLTLWTFQSEAAYRVLAETGVLSGSTAHGDPDLSTSYPWMYTQAAKRIPGGAAVDQPVLWT